MSEASVDKLEQAAATRKRVDELLAHALESSRPTGDLDSRSISLMLVSMVLLVVSVMPKPPGEIDLAGFKLVAVQWPYMVLPLAATTVYLAMHLLMRWWSEQQLWHLQARPSLQETHNQLVDLVDCFDIRNTEWLTGTGTFTDFILSRHWIDPRSFDYEHPEPAFDSPTVVRAALEARFDAAYQTMRERGIFQYMSEQHWVDSMRCAIESEVKLAALHRPNADPGSHQRNAIRQERIATQSNHDRHMLDAPPVPELQQRDAVMTYCRHAAERVNLLVRIGKIQLWSVLLVPLCFAAFSLGAMLVQVVARYAR